MKEYCQPDFFDNNTLTKPKKLTIIEAIKDVLPTLPKRFPAYHIPNGRSLCGQVKIKRKTPYLSDCSIMRKFRELRELPNFKHIKCIDHGKAIYEK